MRQNDAYHKDITCLVLQYK